MLKMLTSATMMERFLWMEVILDLSPSTQEKTTKQKQMQRKKRERSLPK